MSIRWAFAGLLCAALWPGLLSAEDEPVTAEPATSDLVPPEAESASEKPTTVEPATAKPAVGTPAQVAEAGADFQKKLDEFKQVLGKLLALQTRFQLAADADRLAILNEYKKHVEEGNVLVPGLQAAAETAFQADPKNESAAEFLMANLVDLVEADRYSDGARLAAMLAAGGYDEKGFANFAGIAEFCTNDFDSAGVHLSKAARDAAFDKVGKELQPQVGECARLWQAEKELRAAEEQADDLPRVRLTTTKGDIVVELFENEAPNTTANFIDLVEKHFYDGLKFHRVLQGFMAQGGDPKGDGSGGPGYTIPCECYQPNHRNHFGGSLSMANAGPNTGGSQFFLTFAPRPALNGKHTVFGRVIEGLDVLTSLQRMDPDHPNPNAKADEIVKATVIRKRDHEYKPQTTPQ